MSNEQQEPRSHAKPSSGSQPRGAAARFSLMRAKKLPRAAECLVYSLTPSGVLAENHPKNRVSSPSCGVKMPKETFFTADLPLESGLAARARCLGFLAGVAAVS